ncbi:carboxylesterase/lipase family protein [Nocardia pseudovaccinii]|uniref:carboxylesterase/lipase family protein n=1 Tax=Nocardia pseudovaccinii TaxID=189540 RepID=UPI0007A510E0|nr:carboxylesterase family protein [Nocardia pseudovaccinii]
MIVETATGKVRGSADGAVTAFRGIPFATAERFGAPRAPEPWPGIRDSVEIGPAAPQLASRLERVMGRFTVAQAEDCLSLNVWAPAGSGHPVLVFLHGGGFTSGSGGLAWYDGAELAEHGDIVVVTINYRLGVLGYLCLPGVSEGNLGLLDQMAALEWVRDNIAAFGGNPAQVTVAGQSGGALSILAMATGTAGLFRRAILQSTPAGIPPASPEDAAVAGRMLLRELGLAPDEQRRLFDVPVAELLSAQYAVAVCVGGAAPPYQLVADGVLVSGDLVRSASAAGIEVLLGTTKDEAAAMVDDAADTVTHQLFRAPTLRLAETLAVQGNTAWLYRFDWHPATSPFGACHCLELPFLLGNAAAWAHAPMLMGERPQALVEDMRERWIGFIRHGDPGWSRATEHHINT